MKDYDKAIQQLHNLKELLEYSKDLEITIDCLKEQIEELKTELIAAQSEYLNKSLAEYRLLKQQSCTSINEVHQGLHFKVNRAAEDAQVSTETVWRCIDAILAPERIANIIPKPDRLPEPQG